MHDVIEDVHARLRRNKPNDTVRETEKMERHQYAGDSNKEKRKPKCFYCDAEHWLDKCDRYEITEKRKQYFRDNKFCFNCAKKGQRENKCFSRGCFYCKAKHHSSLCEKEEKSIADRLCSIS